MKLRIAQVVMFGTLGLMLGIRQAGASTISFLDTFDPVHRLISGQGSNALCTGDTTTDVIAPLGSCESLTWTHTLQGFNSATDTLTSASAFVTVYNNSPDGPNETFDIVLDFLNFVAQDVPDATTIGAPKTFTYNVLNQLSDGQLVVTLTSANGNHDFNFAKSVLTAEGSTRLGGTAPQATPVPEPATLGLLGLGLVAIASKARARLHRN